MPLFPSSASTFETPGGRHLSVFGTLLARSHPLSLNSFPSLFSLARISPIDTLEDYLFVMADQDPTKPEKDTYLKHCFEASFSSLFLKENIGNKISSLVLPMFQRPYQWGPEHVAKLVRDIECARINKDDNYFAGNIVLVEDETPGDYLIIDGQQRMTTVAMIISVCRFCDSENENKYTTWLTRDVNPKLKGLAKPYRFWPDNGDNPAQNIHQYEKYILDPEGLKRLFGEEEADITSKYVGRLRKNAMCIQELLEEFGQPSVFDFAQYLFHQCKFFGIIATSLEVAYKVFCSINLPSGLPLATMDYYRARLYGRLIKDMKDRPAQFLLREWNEIESNLGGAEQMQKFLLHFCCIQLCSDIRKDESESVYIANAFDKKESVREPTIQTLLQKFFDRTAAKEITNELRKFSISYKKIARTEGYLKITKNSAGKKSASKTVANYPLYLLRYMSEQKLQRRHWDLWITIALKANSIYQIKKSSTFWEKLERLFAFLVITKTTTKQCFQICMGILQQLHQKKSVTDKYEWNELDLSDENVKAFRRVIKGNIYSKHPFAARYLLLNLEARKCQVNLLQALTLENVAATVEHICPQKPRKGTNWLRQPWSEDLRNHWLNKFGNLTLLERSHNSGVLNHGWQDKADDYMEDAEGRVTAFEYTKTLCGNPDWTPDLCDKRQKDLESELFGIYSLGDCDDNGAVEDDTAEMEQDENEELEEESNLNNEVVNVVKKSPNSQTDGETAEGDEIELCGRKIKKDPTGGDNLSCCHTRKTSESYCRTCHCWDIKTGKQCTQQRANNSPFCLKHMSRKGQNKNVEPTVVGATQSQVKVNQKLSEIITSGSGTATFVNIDRAEEPAKRSYSASTSNDRAQKKAKSEK
ncbi:hypothetical protein BKA69DRAFT_1129518 [Paraphysoderma sedebokerense]|nr:hypothetical protein BKA69DRAFT_1129518 [Paraphysoderma sedebokerense]